MDEMFSVILEFLARDYDVQFCPSCPEGDGYMTIDLALGMGGSLLKRHTIPFDENMAREVVVALRAMEGELADDRARSIITVAEEVRKDACL